MPLGLDSRLKVNAILFFHENPESLGNAASVARWIGASPAETTAALSEMAGAGLLVRRGEGDSAIFSYSPSADIQESISAFLLEYKRARDFVEQELRQLETEKAQVESRLQELELSLNVIADNMGEGLLVTDSKGVIRLVNSTAKRWLEVEELVTGASIWSLPLPASLTSAIRQGMKLSQAPLVAQIAIGADSHKASQATVTPIVTKSGTISGSVTVLADVTPLKELDQMKTDLVSFVSHQLKTPLTVVKGYATTLRRKDIQISEAEKEEFLSTISSQVDRLTGLVGSFLDLTRIESGLPLDFRPREVDLDRLVRQIVSEQELLLSTHHLKIDIEEGLSAWVDEEKLVQVLLNLLSNAVKYSEPSTNITISAVQRGTEAALSITDEGQGLTQEEIASLFRRFTRAPGSRGKGTGLGLYINKRLLEAQGGHIEIQSQKGIGSTFTVLLPRKPLPSTPDSKTGA